MSKIENFIKLKEFINKEFLRLKSLENKTIDEKDEDFEFNRKRGQFVTQFENSNSQICLYIEPVFCVKYKDKKFEYELKFETKVDSIVCFTRLNIATFEEFLEIDLSFLRKDHLESFLIVKKEADAIIKLLIEQMEELALEINKQK
jgi:hypothetical protein